jgi:hypothetical protein
MDKNKNTNDFKSTIKYILDIKANKVNTPIIFLFDGHGSRDTGDMIVTTKIKINKEILYNIFNPYCANKKLLIFTQCYSYNIYKSITQDITLCPDPESALISCPDPKSAQSGHSDVNIFCSNTVFMCSTCELDKKASGARMLKFSSEFFVRAQKIKKFSDIELKAAFNSNGFDIATNDKSILITDIFKKYVFQEQLVLAEEAKAEAVESESEGLPPIDDVADEYTETEFTQENIQAIRSKINEESDIEKNQFNITINNNKKPHFLIRHALGKNIYIDDALYPNLFMGYIFNIIKNGRHVNIILLNQHYHQLLRLSHINNSNILSFNNLDVPITNNNNFTLNDDLSISPFGRNNEFVVINNAGIIAIDLKKPDNYRFKIKNFTG